MVLAWKSFPWRYFELSSYCGRVGETAVGMSSPQFGQIGCLGIIWRYSRFVCVASVVECTLIGSSGLKIAEVIEYCMVVEHGVLGMLMIFGCLRR